MTKAMMSTIEVPNDDDKNFGGEETKFNISKGTTPTKVRSLNNFPFNQCTLFIPAIYQKKLISEPKLYISNN